jgi:hypothetical protein
MEAVYAHQSIHSPYSRIFIIVYDVTIANKVLSKGVVEEANKYILLFFNKLPQKMSFVSLKCAET